MCGIGGNCCEWIMMSRWHFATGYFPYSNDNKSSLPPYYHDLHQLYLLWHWKCKNFVTPVFKNHSFPVPQVIKIKLCIFSTLLQNYYRTLQKSRHFLTAIVFDQFATFCLDNACIFSLSSRCRLICSSSIARLLSW